MMLLPYPLSANWHIHCGLDGACRTKDREYLSVKLYAPIYATLIEVEGEEGLSLIWSRSNRHWYWIPRPTRRGSPLLGSLVQCILERLGRRKGQLF